MTALQVRNAEGGIDGICDDRGKAIRGAIRIPWREKKPFRFFLQTIAFFFGEIPARLL